MNSLRSYGVKPTLLAALCAISLSACAQSATPPAAAKQAGDKPDTAAAVDAAANTAAAGPAIDLKDPAAALSNDPTDRAAVKALQSIDPNIEVARIGPAPIPGFREAIVQGSVLYVSDDGRYLIQGSLFDIAAKKDLSQNGISQLRRTELAKVPAKDKIVFAPSKPKYTVEVFTDAECGFCRKMHQEIAEYNKLGIAIEYLAFPRAGMASADFKLMESVWCAQDRQKALTDAKNGRPVSPKTCVNPVAMQYKLGQRIGLQGTPMVVTPDGVALPGYLPPADMLKALERLAAEKQGKAVAAAGAP
jgi:thiol:disulfide interchange protein DsbC